MFEELMRSDANMSYSKYDEKDRTHAGMKDRTHEQLRRTHIQRKGRRRTINIRCKRIRDKALAINEEPTEVTRLGTSSNKSGTKPGCTNGE